MTKKFHPLFKFSSKPPLEKKGQETGRVGNSTSCCCCGNTCYRHDCPGASKNGENLWRDESSWWRHRWRSSDNWIERKENWALNWIAIRMTYFCTFNQQACWNCGRKANETCSGCNLARYCGSFCQHKDWEQHHQACGTNAARSGESQQTTPKPTPAQQTRSSTNNTNSSNSSSSRSSPTSQTPTATNGAVPAKWRNKLMKPKKKYLC